MPPLYQLLAPDQLYAKKNLDGLIADLQKLNKIMVPRRGEMKRAKAKAKAEAAPTVPETKTTATGKLAWKQSDICNVLIKGHTKHYNHSAETAAGTYDISASAEFPSCAFGGYGVRFIPTGAKHADGHDLGQENKLEDAKAIAQRHHDKRIKASGAERVH